MGHVGVNDRIAQSGPFWERPNIFSGFIDKKKCRGGRLVAYSVDQLGASSALLLIPVRICLIIRGDSLNGSARANVKMMSDRMVP
jgi:hypothetical protein